MEMTRAKTIFALAIVVGCFAILWPKIFYPMLLTSVAPPQKHQPTPSGFCCGVVFESDASFQFMAELCSWVLKNDMPMELTTLPLERGGRPPENVVTLCREELLKKCNVDINDIVRSDVDGVVDRRRKLQGLRAQNLTNCLKIHFDIDEESLLAKKSYPQHPILIPRHMRPERPPHLHPDTMHPALREKGRVLPPRVPEKQPPKPGPVPGMRPPMGGPGHIVPPSRTDSTGSMGILMPVYTIGIVVFFVYTIMKVMFKKSEDQKPLIKDFHLDPEQRKFIFAEEYTSGGEVSMKDYIRRQEELEQLRRSRSKSPVVVQQEDKLEEAAEEELEEEEVQPEVKEEVNEVKEETREEKEVKEETKEEVREEEVEETPVEETTFTQEQTQKLTLEKEDKSVEDDIILNKEPITILKMDTGDRDLGEWYLDRGFVKDESTEATESENEPDPTFSTNEQVLQDALAVLRAQKEEEIDQLRKRLEETEKAMERIVAQMENVADKLSVPSTDMLNQTTTMRQKKEDAVEEEELIEDKEVEPEVNETVATEEECPTVEFIRPETEAGPISRAIEQFSEVTADKLISEVLISQTLLEKSLDTCISELDEEAPREDDDRLRRSSSRQSTDDAKLTVMGMEVTVGLESGKKMSRSPTPVKDLLPKPEKTKAAEQPVEYVPSVFLEAALPPDTHLVVSEAECRAEAVPIEQLDLDEMEYETTPVVLSGKMTLSVIGMELVADPATKDESPYEIPERTRPGILREQASEEDVDSPSRGHRVRFMTEPEEVIIPPSDDFELEEYVPTETVFDDKNGAADDEAAEITDLLETASPILVGYRPPTPPIHYENEQEATEEPENEFLTYTELEEAGEVSAEVVGDLPAVQDTAGMPAKLQDDEAINPIESEVEAKEEIAPMEQEEPAIPAHPESDIDGKLLAEIEQEIIAQPDQTENERLRELQPETTAVSDEVQLADETSQHTQEANIAVDDLVVEAEQTVQLDLAEETGTAEPECPETFETFIEETAAVEEASLDDKQTATSDESQYEERTEARSLLDGDVIEERSEQIVEPALETAYDSVPESNLEREEESLEQVIEQVMETTQPEDAASEEPALDIAGDAKQESSLAVDTLEVEDSSEPAVEAETEALEIVHPEDTASQEPALDTTEDVKLETGLEAEKEASDAVEETSSEPAMEPEAELAETASAGDNTSQERTVDFAEDPRQESTLEMERDPVETIAAEVPSEPEAALDETAFSEDAAFQNLTSGLADAVKQESDVETEGESLQTAVTESIPAEPAIEPEPEALEIVHTEDAASEALTLDSTEDAKQESSLEVERETTETIATEEEASESVVEHPENGESEEPTSDVTAGPTQQNSSRMTTETIETEETLTEPAVELELEAEETIHPEDAANEELTADITKDAKSETYSQTQTDLDSRAPDDVSSEPALDVESDQGYVETVSSEIILQEEAETKNEMGQSLHENESYLSHSDAAVTEPESIVLQESESHCNQEVEMKTSDVVVEALSNTELVSPSEEDFSNETVSNIVLQSESNTDPETAIETISAEEVVEQEDSQDKATTVDEEPSIEENLLVASQEATQGTEESAGSEETEEPVKTNVDVEVTLDTEEGGSQQQLEETTTTEVSAQDESTSELAQTATQLAVDATLEEAGQQTVDAVPQDSADHLIDYEPEQTTVGNTYMKSEFGLEDQVLTATEASEISVGAEATTGIEESINQGQCEKPTLVLEITTTEKPEDTDLKTDSKTRYISEETSAVDTEPAQSTETSNDVELLVSENPTETEMDETNQPELETVALESVASDLETRTVDASIEDAEAQQLDETNQILSDPANKKASCNTSDVEAPINVSELAEGDQVERDLVTKQQAETLEEVYQQEPMNEETKDPVAEGLLPAEEPEWEAQSTEIKPDIAETEPRETEEELTFEVIDKSEIVAMDDAEVSHQAGETLPTEEHALDLEDPLNGSHDGPDHETEEPERTQPSTDEGSDAVQDQLEVHVLEEEKVESTSIDDGSYSPDSLEPVKDLAEPEQQTFEQEVPRELSDVMVPVDADKLDEQTVSICETSAEPENQVEGEPTNDSSQNRAAESEVSRIPEFAAETGLSPAEETAQAHAESQAPPEPSKINEEGLVKAEQQAAILEYEETSQEADAGIEPVPTYEIQLENAVADDFLDNLDETNRDSDAKSQSSEMTEETDSGRASDGSKVEEENLTVDAVPVATEDESKVPEAEEVLQPPISELEPVVNDAGVPAETPIASDSSDATDTSLEQTAQGSDPEHQSGMSTETHRVEEESTGETVLGAVSTTTSTEDVVATVESGETVDDTIRQGEPELVEDLPEKRSEGPSNIEDTDPPVTSHVTNKEDIAEDEKKGTTDSTESAQETSLAETDIVEPVVPDLDQNQDTTTDITEPQTRNEDELATKGTSSEGAEIDATIAQLPAEETRDSDPTHAKNEPINDSEPLLEEYPDESEITIFQPRPIPDIPDSILMEIEAQIIPSESYLLGATYERDSVAVHVPYLHQYESTEEPVVEPMCVEYRDYQRDREIEEMEHALETLPDISSEREDPSGSERKASVKSETEEPVISQFVIREDYPDDGMSADEDDVPLTEEDILQARKEIDEIRKLLAHVSYPEGDFAAEDSNSEEAQSTPEETPRNTETQKTKEDLESQLAHAMLEEDPIRASSKGSSPDMEEYEVVGNGQKASPVTEQVTTEAEKSSGAALLRSGAEVLEHPSPLTPTTEATFERINPTEQTESESH